MKYFFKRKFYIWLILFFVIFLLPCFVFAAENKGTLINSFQEEIDLKLDKISIEYNPSKIFISHIYNADFSFNGIGVKWEQDLPAGTNLEFYLKLGDRWVAVKETDEISKNLLDKERKISELILFKEKQDRIQYKVVLTTQNIAVTPQLDYIEIFYIDSTNKGSDFKISAAKYNAQALLVEPNFRIIDRYQWSNARDLISLSRQEEEWPLNYKEVKKIIIHHSGVSLKDSNNDGRINQYDYQAMVRGIYNWHAKVLSWGDIGYNYIIDPNGNIYEGRFGGDGVEAGHVVRSGSCNKSRFGGKDEKIGFNKGTIGITFIGDYDKEFITSQAEEAVIKLIAQKSLEFGINPSGMSHFNGMFLPNILGHDDVDCTTCPGKNVKNRFSVIRQKAQALYQENKNKVVYKASFVHQNTMIVNLKKGEAKEVIFQFRNEGNVPWQNYNEDYGVFLGDNSLKRRLAVLDGFKMALDAGEEEITEESLPDYVVSKMRQPNIYPGDVATFHLTVDDTTTELVKRMVLALGEKGYFSESDVDVIVNNGSNFYRAQKISNSIPPAMLAESNGEFTIQYKNIGQKPWKKNEVYLNIYDREGNLSKFVSDSWKSEYGGIGFEETEVIPGGKATFKFSLKAPGPGFHRQMFKLERKYVCNAEDELFCFEDIEIGQEAKDFIPGAVFDIITRVDWPYQGQLMENTLTPAMLNIWRPTVLMRFKNIGTVTWKNLRLVSYDEKGSVSDFKDTSWVDNYTVARTSKEINPGEEISFIFKLKAPREKGEYRQNFVLKVGKRVLYIDGVKENEFVTRVD